MGRIGLSIWLLAACTASSVLLWRATTTALTLDAAGDIKLGVRTYVNARVGTEGTHDGVILGDGTPEQPYVSSSGTFPHSDAGHLRQNRYYIEVELNHDLTQLVKQGTVLHTPFFGDVHMGPVSFLNDMPFKLKGLGYHLTFRGEGEMLYNQGPAEYSTAREFNKLAKSAITLAPPIFPEQQAPIDVAGSRHHLRQLGTDQERVFQAYGETSVGNLFLRVGRQILSWGETDAFQLLDHINPIDNSFGGFLIPLDERRVPLDMILANYYLGNYGPFSEMYLEGYGAYDNKVGFYPGTPEGSPWALPSLGAPSNSIKTFIVQPSETMKNMRGGALLKFNAFDATFSIAHYYTYFDIPTVQVYTNPGGLLDFFLDQTCPTPTGGQIPCGYPTHVFQRAPKVQVSGATTTFAIPQFYSIVRSEFAYFRHEAAFTQKGLDPFFFQPLKLQGGRIVPIPGGSTTGGSRTRDSLNGVVGLDVNQWIRFLNPNQTFFISTQFFYKHIIDAANGTREDGNIEVLPIQLNVVRPNDYQKTSSICGGTCPPPGVLGLVRVEPVFIHQPTDQYLQTFFIGTSYRSGTVNPGFTFFYDWGGAFLYQPSLTLSRDPFRLVIDYSILDSHIYKGGSGVSLFKDRDNVQFRLEYVI